jgi:LPXTG-motif cell wall-anchored protein
LVNDTNQAALTRAPGAATALVNGVPVEVDVVSKADSPAAQTAPEDRTPEQVEELQQAATEVVGLLDEVAGGDSGVEVVETETGAELTGVFPDTNVPVEDVIVVDIDESATLFAARDGNGDIVEVQPGAVLEVTPDGEVAVLAYGLPAGDEVELVIMSTPTLLGSFTVDESGSIETRASMPATIGSGDHTLVVASPNVKAALGLKIADTTAPVATTLPATGSNTATPIVITLLALGSLLALTARRRRDLTGV